MSKCLWGQETITAFFAFSACRRSWAWESEVSVSYLLGEVQVLCPACRHSPQSLDRFGGGGSDGGGVVLVEVVGGGVTGGEWSCEEAGPPLIVSMGFGRVVSFILSGQNSWILSYRYHCCWRDSPAGGRTGGKSSLVGLQSPFFKIFLFSSGGPDLFFTKHNLA